MEANTSVGATVGPAVAAVGGTVGDRRGRLRSSGSLPREPVAAGGAVGAGTAVAGIGESVAGGAGVAGTDVGTWVGAGPPPPQAARKTRIRVRNAARSGNLVRWEIQRNMWDPLRQKMG